MPSSSIPDSSTHRAPLLTTDDMCERFACHRTTIARMVANGRIPKPLKLTPSQSGRLRWNAADVEAAERAMLAGVQS